MKIKGYKIFLENNNYDDVKSVIKDVMDDVEDEFGFDCIYHRGASFGENCDLSLVIPLQRNTIDNDELYWIEKAMPSKSIGLEKIKQKYMLVHQRLCNNTYIEDQGIEIIGMMVYFRETVRCPVFSNPKFISWDDFVEDVNYGVYLRAVKKIPNLEEVDCLVILFKKS